ncbi:MAG: hypothetical protein ABGX20_11385 [Bacillus sp. (in: firmicutes)]
MRNMGFQLKHINEREEKELEIQIEGTASDEIELIGKALHSLISEYTQEDMLGPDERCRFRQEMKRIMLAVAENYHCLGIYNDFIQDFKSLFSYDKN